MGKKNPYITTIGFNREDSEHVLVANLLNEIGRGKAVYIVKAILCYVSLKQKSRGKPIKKSMANKPFTNLVFVHDR